MPIVARLGSAPKKIHLGGDGTVKTLFKQMRLPPSYTVSVNGTPVSWNEILNDGDFVGLSPLIGGQNIFAEYFFELARALQDHYVDAPDFLATDYLCYLRLIDEDFGGILSIYEEIFHSAFPDFWDIAKRKFFELYDLSEGEALTHPKKVVRKLAQI